LKKKQHNTFQIQKNNFKKRKKRRKEEEEFIYFFGKETNFLIKKKTLKNRNRMKVNKIKTEKD